MTTQKRPQLCAHGASSSPAPGSLTCRDDMNVNRSRSNLRMQRTGPDGSGCPPMASIWMNLLWFRVPDGERTTALWGLSLSSCVGMTCGRKDGKPRIRKRALCDSERKRKKANNAPRSEIFHVAREQLVFLYRQRSVRRTDWSSSFRITSLRFHCHISINPEWDCRRGGGHHVGGDDHAKGAKMGEAARQEHVLLRWTGDDGPAEGSLLPHPVPHRRHLRSLLRFRVRLLCPPGTNKSLIFFFYSHFPTFVNMFLSCFLFQRRQPAFQSRHELIHPLAGVSSKIPSFSWNQFFFLVNKSIPCVCFKYKFLISIETWSEWAEGNLCEWNNANLTCTILNPSIATYTTSSSWKDSHVCGWRPIVKTSKSN